MFRWLHWPLVRWALYLVINWWFEWLIVYHLFVSWWWWWSYQLACCCSGTAFSLCCSACPTCRNSTSTRIMYALMLILTTLTSYIMMSDWIVEKIQEVPFCKNGSTYDKACQEAVGYLAVYRLLFAQTIFFVMFSVLMLNVKSSRDGRAPLQNGFWAIKYMILIGLCIGSFFIPEGDTFGSVWMYFGMTGGFLFIMIQLILIIDFAHSWAEHWVEKFEETNSKAYYVGLLFFTILNFLIALAGIVIFYIYYTTGSGGCGIQKFFISFTLILCIAISVLSILPQIQEAQPRSGLLQASMISLYTVYLTWSAMNNATGTDCKPSFLSSPSSKNFDAQALVGLAIWFGCVLYSSIRTSTNSQVAKITMSEKILMKDSGGNGQFDTFFGTIQTVHVLPSFRLMSLSYRMCESWLKWVFWYIFSHDSWSSWPPCPNSGSAAALTQNPEGKNWMAHWVICDIHPSWLPALLSFWLILFHIPSHDTHV